MLNKLTKGHWPIFLLSSLSSMANLFLPIILVRIMSPEDVGVYKIFFLHLAAIPFIVMAGGPIHSVFYWVGKKDGEAYINATFTLTILLSSLVLLLGFPMSDYLASHLDLPAKYISILLMAGFLWCPSGHYGELSIAKGFSARGSLFDAGFEIIKAFTFIIIAIKTRNLTYLFTSFAVLMFIKLLLGSWLGHLKYGLTIKSQPQAMKAVLLYCSPVAFSGLLSFFVDKVDLLLLSSQLDPASFAFYSMGCLIVPPLFLLEMSVQKVLIPALARSFVDKRFDEGAAHFRKAIKDISFLIIPSIFGLIVFAKPIVEILYTDRYLESSLYLQLYAFSYLLLMFPHDSVARASGETKWILKVYLLVTPISLLTALLCARQFGAKGVLVGTLAVRFIPKFLGLRLSKKIMGWKWQDMFPLRTWAFYIAVCTGLSLGSLLLKQNFVSEVTWFLVCGTAFAAIYLGLVYNTVRKANNANG